MADQGVQATPAPSEHARAGGTRTACALCGCSVIRPYRQLTRSYARTDYVLSLGRCTRCGFVFLQNDPQIPYDHHYLTHEGVITGGDPMARFRALERVARIARLIPPGRHRRFLDIGIGDGLLLSVAETAGYATFGLDVSPDAVEIARTQFGLQAVMQVGPFERAFPDETFDVIHLSEVIEHVAEPMALLRWCRAHLTRGGCLVVQTGNIDALASRLKGASWDYFRPVHVSYFSARTLRDAARRAGFRMTHCMTTDWRLGASLRMTVVLFRRKGLLAAGGFLFFYLTTIPRGLRRTVTVYAT